MPDIVGDNSKEMLFGDRNGLLTCLSGGYDSTTIAVNYFPSEPFEFLIFPNPNNGSFRIRMVNQELMDAGLCVTDIQGRTVQELPAVHFDQGISSVELNLMDGLKPGLYFLEVRTHSDSFRAKLILRR